MRGFLLALVCSPLSSFGRRGQTPNQFDSFATLLRTATPTSGFNAGATARVGGRLAGVSPRYMSPTMEEAVKTEEATATEEAAPVVKEKKISWTVQTAPWYTKTGQDELKQIEKEENERAREIMKYPSSRTTIQRIRNGLVAPLPAVTRRGFTAFWEGDAKGVVSAPKKKSKEPEEVELYEQWFREYDEERMSEVEARLSELLNLYTGSGYPWDDDSWKAKVGKAPFWTKDGVRNGSPSAAIPSRAVREKKPRDGPLPPLWSKAGMDYVRENGVGEYFDEPEYTPPMSTGPSPVIDGKWGVWKKDPLKDDAITNTFKALSKAGAQRYEPSRSGEQKEDAIDATLRAVSEAFWGRQSTAEKKGFSTQALELSLMRVGEMIAKQNGGDTTKVSQVVKELEEEAAAAETK